MALGLGDFAGQLTADELARALAMAGGRPDELPLVQPQPALPAPAPDMSIQAPRGAPGRNIRELDAAQLSDANARIDLAGRGGEQQAQAFEQRAGVRREQAMRARETVEGARSDMARRREHEDKYQAEADRIYEEMKAHTQPPPASVLSKIMPIVAMVAASQGKAGAAQGAAMIGSMFGKDPARWEAEQRANSNLYQNALSMIDRDRSGASHDLDVAQRITALEGHEYEAALGAIAEQTQSAGMRQAALDTQLELRMKTRSALRAMEEAKLKQAGARQRSAAEEYFWRVPFDQLRQMPSQVLGETGQKVLKERTGVEGGLKKLDAEGGEAPPQVGQMVPGGRRVADPSVYSQIEKPTLTKYVDGEDKARRALRNMAELKALVKEHGTETLPGQTKSRMQQLGAQIQLDLKDAGELGALDKGSAEYLAKLTGDPTAWNFGLGNVIENVDTKLEEAENMIRYQTESRAKSLGLEYDPAQLGETTSKTFSRGAGAGLASGQRPALPANAAQTVTMVRPDGKPFQVHPTQVERLRAAGWRDEAVAGGAFIAQPADLMAQRGGM